MAKDIPFNKQCWGHWKIKLKGMKSGPYLIPFTKIKLKQITNLNIRMKTKLLGANIGKKLIDIDLQNDFLHIILKYKTLKQKLKCETKPNFLKNQ